MENDEVNSLLPVLFNNNPHKIQYHKDPLKQWWIYVCK